jgi:site-specific recombinase XerD
LFLRDVYEAFLVEQTQIRAKTREHHGAAIKALLSWAGESVTLAEVSRTQAGKFIGTLKTRDKPKTVQRKVSSLSSFWNWMGMRGHIADYVEGNSSPLPGSQ